MVFSSAYEALTFAGGSVVFALVEVGPRYTPNPATQTVDVVFQVNEGPRVYVDRINIVGNTVTQDPVIRREMQLVEGDAFNRILLDNSKNRIRALGFFKEVEIEEQPGSAPDRTNVQVKVEEQPTGELAFSAGYSTIDKLIVDLSVTQRNWAGRGESVRARIQTGSLRKTIDFSFTEPRFLGRNLAAGVDLFSYRYDYTRQAGYILGQTGGERQRVFGVLDGLVGIELAFADRQHLLEDVGVQLLQLRVDGDLAEAVALALIDGEGDGEAILDRGQFGDRRGDAEVVVALVAVELA
jgi:outer membrane protein insertion porin family